jgi:hypothetical protein
MTKKMMLTMRLILRTRGLGAYWAVGVPKTAAAIGISLVTIALILLEYVDNQIIKALRRL